MKYAHRKNTHTHTVTHKHEHQHNQAEQDKLSTAMLNKWNIESIREFLVNTSIQMLRSLNTTYNHLSRNHWLKIATHHILNAHTLWRRREKKRMNNKKWRSKLFGWNSMHSHGQYPLMCGCVADALTNLLRPKWTNKQQ